VKDAWRLSYEGYDPAGEGLREALCTLGNGYFATRGCAPECDADAIHYPGTYVAGLYNRLTSTVRGREVSNEDLVNLPNWLPVRFRIEDGDWFSPDTVRLLEYRQVLELYEGVWRRELRFDDGAGRMTRVRVLRFVSMSIPHLAGQRLEIEPENWSGAVEVSSELDGRVANDGVARYRGLSNRHLAPVAEAFPEEATQFLKTRTSQSGVEIAVGALTQLFMDGDPLRLKRRNDATSGRTRQRCRVNLEQGRCLTVDKTVALYTSLDRAISECGEAACLELRRMPPLDELLAAHRRRWRQLWDRFGLEVEWSPVGGVESATMILRLHIFHLLQTVSKHTLYADAGVPARGLHGEAYRGHVFWDELFILPVFNLRMPELTRTLLMYRYHRLPAARAAAREAGYRGAMFPWQSASDGREQTQTLHLNPKSGEWIPDRSRLQRHVSLAIAYNVWDYFEASRDLEFLINYGAELFLEIAAFWSSKAAYDTETGRYDIHGVMGPDEYHDGYPDRDEGGVSNNTYTNVMASWTLQKALHLLFLLPRTRELELCERLGFDEDELQRWDEVSKKLRIVFHADGIPSQFQGYEQLEEFDWEGYRERYGDIRRLDRILDAEGKTPNRYKVSKQPDVLMLFYLLPVADVRHLFAHLGYELDGQTVDRTIDYYLKRTSDGSTLSQVAHAHLLAQQQPRDSWRLFVEALHSDVNDVQGGTTQEGIHLGAMAGTVDLMQSAYVGMRARPDALHLDPDLPEPLTCIRLNTHYRGHYLSLEIREDRLLVTADESDLPPMQLVVRGHRVHLGAGEHREFKLS